MEKHVFFATLELIETDLLRPLMALPESELAQVTVCPPIEPKLRTFLEMTTDTPSTPLTGKPLLLKVKELRHLPRRETARRCGYFSITKNNQTRVNLGEFLNAVLEAKGVPLSPDGIKDGRGREPTYRVSVHKNGQIVIGSTYTEAMGLKPGDEFEIKLGYKHIHLIHLGAGEIPDEDMAA
jgi:hypothetical protein